MGEAVKLLLTGMSTVFLILIFVVLLGNLIIIITNKFGGDNGAITDNSVLTEKNIDSKKLAAIVAAVNLVTKEKGNVTSVQKTK